MSVHRAPALAGLLYAVTLVLAGCTPPRADEEATPSLYLEPLPDLPVTYYFVRDLLTPMLGFMPPPVPTPEELAKQSRVDSPVPIITPARKVEECASDETPIFVMERPVVDILRDLVERTVTSEEPWESAGGRAAVRILEPLGPMFVRQTPAGQWQVDSLLDSLRREQRRTVSIEAWFIEADRAATEAIAEWLATRRPAASSASQPLATRSDNDAPSAAPKMDVLDAEQAAAFLQEIRATKRGKLVFAPRLTLWNGQRTFIMDGVSRGTLLPRLDKAPPPVEVVYLMCGHRLDVQAIASEDRRHVQLVLRPHYVELIDASQRRAVETSMGPVMLEVPVVRRTEATVSGSVPDGGALVIRMPLGAHARLVGARGTTDAATGEDGLEPVWEPVEAGGEPQGFLWLLVKATIGAQPDMRSLPTFGPNAAESR